MSGFDGRPARLFSGTSIIGASLFAVAAHAQPAESPVKETPAESMQTAQEPKNTANTAITNDQPGNDQGGLEVITVTARKVAENLQSVPVAVTAFSGTDLANQNIQRVQDIGNFTPGAQIRQGPQGSNTLILAVRGQIQTDQVATLDPSVGVYVDGIYWARAYGLNGDFVDISNVQVLKGPQGTLFGRNTTGGALLINSNDPKLGELSGRASVTYGRFDEFETVGVLNVPLGDKLALRLAASRTTRDGYTTNVLPPSFIVNGLPAGSPLNGTTFNYPATGTILAANDPIVARTPFTGSPYGLKFDNRHRLTARGKLLFQATDNLSFLASAEYFRSNERPSRVFINSPTPYTASLGANPNNNIASTGALFVGTTNGGPAPINAANVATDVALGLAILNSERAFLSANPQFSSNNEVNYSYAKTQTYNFITTLDTDFGAMKLFTNYRKVKSHSGFDLDGSSLALAFTENQQNLKQMSGELQITGKAFDTSVDFAGGAFVFHEEGSDRSISITIPTLNIQTSQAWSRVDNDSMGLYGQATWHVTDSLSFTGGLRYSVDDKGIDLRNNNFNRGTGATTCTVATNGRLLNILANGTTEVASFNIPREINPVQCQIRRRDSFSGWSYTAGLDYKPTEDILLYVKTSKGFRSGGQNLRTGSPLGFRPFDPEVAYAYEVGFKGEFLDRRLRVNLAAYTTDVKDIQRSTLVAVPNSLNVATFLGNAGKARFRGLEAEITALLFEGFR
ncbi:MAG: TonB-dependent receptor, partial [Rhizorhabdus sp.]